MAPTVTGTTGVGTTGVGTTGVGTTGVGVRPRRTGPTWTGPPLHTSRPPEHRPDPVPFGGTSPPAPVWQPTLFADDRTELSSTPPLEGDPALPDAAPTAAALVRLVLECLAGRRSPVQLSPWFSESVLTELVIQRGLRRRSLRHPVLRMHSVRVQHPGPAVAEVSVHLRGERRSQAWALRLEARRQHWLCTCLELGPRRAGG